VACKKARIVVASVAGRFRTHFIVASECMKLIVKKSRIHGKGLFAGEDIPWGLKVIEYKGEVITDEVALARIAEGADCIFELGHNKNIDGAVGGNEARYANHERRKPNCFVLRDKGKIWLVAGIEGIGKGEEITFDYGSTFYER
jgi:SET domain-containing protein